MDNSAKTATWRVSKISTQISGACDRIESKMAASARKSVQQLLPLLFFLLITAPLSLSLSFSNHYTPPPPSLSLSLRKSCLQIQHPVLFHCFPRTVSKWNLPATAISSAPSLESIQSRLGLSHHNLQLGRTSPWTSRSCVKAEALAGTEIPGGGGKWTLQLPLFCHHQNDSRKSSCSLFDRIQSPSR